MYSLTSDVVYSAYLEALRDHELLRAGVLYPECTLCIP
jgi:hypothetical protein